MSASGHRLGRLLDQGGLALGMGIRHFRAVEIGRMLSVCGYDWALIDLEHSSMSIDVAAQLSIACEDAAVTPLARVPQDDHQLATRLLDGGAMGVVFPHVDNAEAAARLVEACKYPPLGHRSMGGAQLAQLGFRTLERADAATLGNEATLMVMMIETPGGVANADEIAKVPGVDVVMIGCNDLTVEMGIPGQFDHPRLVTVFEEVAAACLPRGKHIGMGGVYDLELVRRYIGLGTRLILSGGDGATFMNGARRFVKELHSPQ